VVAALVTGLSATLVASPVQAQPPAPGVDAALDAARELRGAALQVSVLTFANGAVIFERFGHNALIVTDTVSGESRAYNWGVFDFDQPNFLMRFLTGDTRYWLAVYPTQAMFDSYVAQDRTGRMQRLALSNVQKAALYEYLQWNATEESRYYRYDYYLDNCSTRVRDAIDRVLGGQLARALEGVPEAPRTWRGETARVTDGDWPIFFGIHLALGRNADADLSRWNESFMPGLLADHLATVTIADENGVERALVSQDTVLYQANRAPIPDQPPFRGLTALMLGTFAGGLIFALGWWRDKGARIAIIMIRAVATLWYLVGGLLGTALLLAGTVTKHAEYMGTNISLLQLHPLLLVLAACSPLAMGHGKGALLAARLAMLVAIVAVLGLVLQLTVWSQASGIVTSITVPVHIALAGILSQRARSPRVHSEAPHAAPTAPPPQPQQA
jgi:hypothetical protein